MLQITPHQKFYLSLEPLDFRKGVDAIAAVCEQKLQTDPMSGILFIFTNRRRTAIKVLVYDGQGFWLCLKRFSRGHLAWWPQSLSACHLSASQLQILFSQGNPTNVNVPLDWKPIESR
jgi:transposase